MQRNLMWTLKQLHLSLEQYGKAQMKELDLSLTQGIVLHYLLAHEDQAIYAVDLHATLGISKSSVSSALKSLKQKGYLRMAENPKDDRKKRIVLTDKAHHAERAIEASLARQQERLLKAIPDQHLKWLEDDLNLMLSHVNRQIRLEENV